MLLTKKVIILAKYLDFINIFSKKFTIVLIKYLSINKDIINIKVDKKTTLKANL